MNTKISIACLALVASTSSFAIIGPGRPSPEVQKACIKISKGLEGAQFAGNCDESRNNVTLKKALLNNGCAKGQALFTSVTVDLQDCRDPRIVQL